MPQPEKSQIARDVLHVQAAGLGYCSLVHAVVVFWVAQSSHMRVHCHVNSFAKHKGRRAERGRSLEGKIKGGQGEGGHRGPGFFVHAMPCVSSEYRLTQVTLMVAKDCAPWIIGKTKDGRIPGWSYAVWGPFHATNRVFAHIVRAVPGRRWSFLPHAILCVCESLRHTRPVSTANWNLRKR